MIQGVFSSILDPISARWIMLSMIIYDGTGSQWKIWRTGQNLQKFSNNQYVQEVDYNQYVLILRIHSHYKHLQTTIKTALWVL